MKKIIILFTLLIFAFSSWPVQALNAPQESEPVIIYLFWGDGCPHCETAKPALRALADRHENVELREYEVWFNPENQTLFFEMAARIGFEPRAVPTIIIADRYWEGFHQSLEADMEEVIVNCLQNGCSDPALGLLPAPVIEQPVPVPSDTEPSPAPTDAEIQPTVSPTALPEPALIEPAPLDLRPPEPEGMRDDGFILAIFTMLVMALALVYSLAAFMLGKTFLLPAWADWLIPAIIVFGIGVAGYLSYVETQQVAAVCGPVGDCNAVQTSPYATLFGFLPVGVLGLLGYVGLLAAWLARKILPRFEKLAVLAFLGMSVFAVIFSLYLTYLELFVIHAVCIWCIISAWLVTFLLLLGLPPAVRLYTLIEEDE
jgi:uncharacterized membrane protein/thiol-disulfide isomerase/thioredoxin